MPKKKKSPDLALGLVASVFIFALLAPMSLGIVNAVGHDPDGGYTDPVDLWTLAHFISGVAVASVLIFFLGVHPAVALPFTVVLGILAEPVEHGWQALAWLAADGGYEGWANILVDELAVALGGLAVAFSYND